MSGVRLIKIPQKNNGDVAKLNGNSFYGKMIKDLGRHKSAKFTRQGFWQAFRFPFFGDLEEIGGVYEIKQFKRTVMIKRPYQCCIAIYQITKLRVLEFYYDFLVKYLSRQDFTLAYTDTDLLYIAMSGDSSDEIAKPEMKQAYEADKKNWLATDKFSERTPALFKPEFAKCYLVQNEARQNKGVSKEHNNMYFHRYKDVLVVFLKTKRDSELEDIDEAKNVGFKVFDQGMVTYIIYLLR